jgi:transmembrane sensor
LKALGALLVGGTAAYSVRQTTAWQRYAADYQTGIGEMREIVLADSSHATLNTASAMDVHFDTRKRRVELRTGEVLIATAHDPATPARPFLVTTTHGTVRALGTRFIVRQTAEALSHVSVFEGAVTIQPLSQSAPAIRIEAGQQASFSGTATQAVAPVEESASAWANGSLLVERMRLDDFLRELSRYRPGILRCDPAAAHHVLTGVYPLADTDRILASLEKALPVKIVYRSRYWVTVTTR